MKIETAPGAFPSPVREPHARAEGFGALLHRLEQAMWPGAHAGSSGDRTPAPPRVPPVDEQVAAWGPTPRGAVLPHGVRQPVASRPSPGPGTAVCDAPGRGVAATAVPPPKAALAYAINAAPGGSAWPLAQPGSAPGTDVNRVEAAPPQAREPRAPGPSPRLDLIWQDDGVRVALCVDARPTDDAVAAIVEAVLRDLHARGIPVAQLTLNGRPMRPFLPPTQRNPDGDQSNQ